jgi:hypothetical protein
MLKVLGQWGRAGRKLCQELWLGLVWGWSLLEVLQGEGGISAAKKLEIVFLYPAKSF